MVTSFLYTIKSRISITTTFRDLLVLKYSYFIGIEMEDINGKMWIPYVNEKRYDWDQLIDNNIRISITD